MARDPRRWMWAEALQMLEQADRLHRQFFQIGSRAMATPRWEPPVDIFESEGEVWIFYALPGVAPDAVEVTVDDNLLVVRGERQLPQVAHTTTIRRLEIPHGRFERRLGLPEGRFELLAKQFDRGCLVIGLRRID